jgi:tetratricopeptide (TPR) repeat protein
MLKILARFLMVLLFTGAGMALQASVADSTATGTASYTVKKKAELLADVATKFNTDVKTLAVLNNLADTVTALSKGMKLLVPVVATKKNSPQVKAKGNKDKGDKPVSDTTAVITTPPKPRTVQYFDRELLKNRLLLVDASLELNQGLMEGLHASLDSLDVPDKQVVNEKDMQATLHNMQRARDRAILRPELIHMQDSLQTEIKKLLAEKDTIESRLARPVAVIAAAPVTPVVAVPKTDTAAAPLAVIKDTAGNKTEASRNRHNKKHSQPAVADTILVYNTGPVVQKDTPVIASIQKPNKKHRKGDELKEPQQEESGGGHKMEPMTAAEPQYSQAIALPEDTTLANIPEPEDAKNAYTLRMQDSISHIKAEFFLIRGRKQINEHSYKSAIDNLKKAVELYPKYSEAWMDLGDAEQIQGNFSKALEDYRACEKFDSAIAKLYFKIGNALQNLNQKDGSLNAYRKSLNIDKAYIPSMMAIGSLLSDDKKYDEAIKQYDTVLQTNISFRAAYKARGIARYMKKDYEAAIDDLSRYLIFKEADGGAYYYRGLARIGSKNNTDGCLDLNTSLQLGYATAEKAVAKYCNDNKDK